jgi:hypothetical protein
MYMIHAFAVICSIASLGFESDGTGNQTDAARPVKLFKELLKQSNII